jgi:hypothetical protein
MIFKSSRYAAVPIYTVTDRSGRAYRALAIRVIPPTPAAFRHAVSAADRLDLIAFQYYGKADRFWRVCDANSAMQPEELLHLGRSIFVPPDLTA